MKYLFASLIILLSGCIDNYHETIIVIPNDYTGVVAFRSVQDSLSVLLPRKVVHYYRPGYLDTIYDHAWAKITVAKLVNGRLEKIKFCNKYGDDLRKETKHPKGIFFYALYSFDYEYKISLEKVLPGDETTRIFIVDSLQNYSFRLRQLHAIRKQLIYNKYGRITY